MFPYFDMTDIWADLPPWSKIVEAWIGSMVRRGIMLDDIVRDVAIVVPDSNGMVDYVDVRAAWWPRSLDDIHLVENESASLLTEGVSRHWTRHAPTNTRLARMGAQSAGMRDGSPLIAENSSSPAAIAAVMIAMTGMSHSESRGPISPNFHATTLLAQAAIAALGYEGPAGANRRNWLPFHLPASDAPDDQSIEQVLDLFTTEHAAVLSEWRVVNYVPHVRRGGVLSPIPRTEIIERDEMISREANRFIRMALSDHSNLPKRHDEPIRQAILATGRAVDHYLKFNGRLPLITSWAKPSSSGSIVTVHRKHMACDPDDLRIKFVDLKVRPDGILDPESAAALTQMLDEIDELETEENDLKARGLDPSAIPISKITVHPVLRAGLVAAGIDPARHIEAFKDAGRRGVRLVNDAPTFTQAMNPELGLRHLDLTAQNLLFPCGRNGSILVRSTDEGLAVRWPRRGRTSDHDDLQELLASPALKGVTGVSITSRGYQDAIISAASIPLVDE